MHARLKVTLLAGLALLLAAPAWGAEGWSTNLTEAQAQAAKENKDILLSFDGSDW